jgi:hypothetical protein
MASPTRRARKALKVERSCEASRLEEEVIAAAYELVTPIRRCPLPEPATSRPPAFVHAPEAGSPQCQTGGR